MTSSADQSVKLWDCETGVQLHSFNFDAPARAVSFSEGDQMVVITTDPFMEQQSAIHVKRIEADRSLRTCFHYLPSHFDSKICSVLLTLRLGKALYDWPAIKKWTHGTTYGDG